MKDWFFANPTSVLLYANTELSYFQVMIWFVMLPLLMKIRKTDGE